MIADLGGCVNYNTKRWKTLQLLWDKIRANVYVHNNAWVPTVGRYTIHK
jgi:hypothetical protein